MFLNKDRDYWVTLAYLLLISCTIVSRPPCPVAVWARLIMIYVSSIESKYLTNVCMSPHSSISYLLVDSIDEGIVCDVCQASSNSEIILAYSYLCKRTLLLSL